MQLLQANGLTAARFEAAQRNYLRNKALNDAVLGGVVTPPAVVVDPLVKSRGETRGGTFVFLAYSAALDVPAPDEAAIKAYYDGHPDAFKTPEYRAATVLAVTAADATADFHVSDDQLRTEYEQRKDSLTTPEKRDVQQILAKDEETAKRVESDLKAGKAPEEVAKAVPGQNPGSISLGLLERGDLPNELAGPAFNLPDGGVSDPIHTPLGWHVLRIAKIEPAVTQSFEAARAAIEADDRREEAAKRLDQLNNRIGDALAAGNSIAEIAKNNGFKTMTVPAVDRDGKDADGKPVSLPFDPILPEIFQLKAGETSPLQTASTGDGGLFAVHLDSVTPPARKPLEAIKQDVASAALRDRQKVAMETRGTDIMAAAAAAEGRPAKTLATVAAADASGPVPLAVGRPARWRPVRCGVRWPRRSAPSCGCCHAALHFARQWATPGRQTLGGPWSPARPPVRS